MAGSGECSATQPVRPTTCSTFTTAPLAPMHSNAFGREHVGTCTSLLKQHTTVLLEDALLLYRFDFPSCVLVTSLTLCVMSESVIVSPEGVATMLDKFGGVHEALQMPDGSYQLRGKPRAWLGPGRPLGAAFDAQGNLYVCDALKVGLCL